MKERESESSGKVRGTESVAQPFCDPIKEAKSIEKERWGVLIANWLMATGERSVHRTRVQAARKGAGMPHVRL